MTDIEILHQMIKDTARLTLEDHYEKKKVILTEPQCSKSTVSIYGIPENAIIIKADTFKSPDAIFCGSSGECKRADYVVMADAGNKKVILCIEMKATSKTLNEITLQLKGAQCFVAYCREIGKTFWNQKQFLDDYVYRFICIGHTSIPKKKTRIERKYDVHDKPENMLKIDWPHHLQFNQLAGAC